MTAFDPNLIPPHPDLIPDDLRVTVDNTSDWSTKVPPQALGMFIAAVVQWLSHPRFGAKVTADTQSDGWTIRVELPKPDIREDITL